MKNKLRRILCYFFLFETLIRNVYAMYRLTKLGLLYINQPLHHVKLLLHNTTLFGDKR